MCEVGIGGGVAGDEAAAVAGGEEFLVGELEFAAVVGAGGVGAAVLAVGWGF